MTNAANAGFWSTAAPYVAALVAAAAILAAAWISHTAKISEFRQTWINDLRNDISDYIGIAEKWFRKWDEGNSLGLTQRESFERDQFFPIANEARVVLRRIRLRFNPRDNQHKAEDDRFLASLGDLLNPAKVPPTDSEVAWQRLADASIEQAREILKREWQVTKKFPLFR
jgi:hypothetical protein